MSDLQDLYQEMILDHGRRPRNSGAMPDATCQADGFNPLCGDCITVFAKINGDKIESLSFEGNGCAISQASASLMTEALKEANITTVSELFEKFHTLVTGKAELVDPDSPPPLGKLEVFGGVQRFPTRVKCATLAWHTLMAAIKGQGDTVTTE